jgi:hypothetical protein
MANVRPGRSACSFCGKGRDQVRRLIAGPRVFICDECVQLCTDIMAADPSGPPACPQPHAVTSAPSPAKWRRLLPRLWRSDPITSAPTLVRSTDCHLLGSAFAK